MEQYQAVQSSVKTYRIVKYLILSLTITLFVGVLLGSYVALITDSVVWFFLIPIIASVITVFVVFVIVTLEIANLGYGIDANAIRFREGILSLHRITVPFARITNANFHQSFFQRIFQVGDIAIDQEDSEYKWRGVDVTTANKIIEEITSKSNVQPITMVTNKTSVNHESNR